MTESSSDEIDLQELAVRLIQSFKRHSLLFIVLSIGGTALSAGYWKLQPQVFESQMIVVTDILTRPYGLKTEQNLNNLIGEGNVGGLSSRLGLSTEEAARLVHIEIESIPEVKSRERTKDVEIIKEQTYFIIKVKITDFHVLPKLQEGFLQFLNDNEYVKAVVAEKTKINQALVSKIDDQLKAMDLLKEGIGKKETADHKDQSTELMEASSLFTEYVHLNKLKLEYQQEEGAAKRIQLVEGFTLLEKPTGPQLFRYLLGGFVLGLGAAIGFLIIRKLFQLAR